MIMHVIWNQQRMWYSDDLQKDGDLVLAWLYIKTRSMYKQTNIPGIKFRFHEVDQWPEHTVFLI